MLEITAEQLVEAGAYDMHWNPKHEGGYHEYGVPVRGVPFEYGSIYISVTLDERVHDCPVSLRGNMTQIPCHGVKSIEVLMTLHRLMVTP